MARSGDVAAIAPPGGRIAHWSRDPQVRAGFVAMFWLYVATLVIFTTNTAIRDGLTIHYFLGMAVPMLIGDAMVDVMCIVAVRATVGQPALRRWTIIVAVALIDALLATMWDTRVRFWVGEFAHDASFIAGMTRVYPLNLYHTGFFITLLAFQGAFYELREKQRQLVSAQAGERSAHLAALRLQLNPHFLFNSMNALSGLVVTRRNEAAEQMIGRLSGFLRATLSSDPASLVPLEEEFEMLETYLAIETVRFGDRLDTVLELPAELAHVRIPPFLLQPLVENAVKYAVAPARRPVCVRVEASREGDALVLAVVDDGEGCEGVASGTGVGLVNIRERLRLEFGPRAVLDTRCDAGGFTAVIRVPDLLGHATAPRPAADA